MDASKDDSKLSRTWTCLRTANDDQAKEIWGEIFRHYQARLAVRIHCRISKVLARRVSAEDLLQDIYLRAYERRQRLTDPSGRGPLRWLTAITDRVLLETTQRESIRIVASLDAADDGAGDRPGRARKGSDVAARAKTASKHALRDETVRRAVRILRLMDADDREIILRVFYEGWSHQDLAREHAISEGASRKRLERARDRLEQIRRRLDAEEGTVALPHEIEG